jgi:23S rRNA (uracil1939-C5)-methyltransferase
MRHLGRPIDLGTNRFPIATKRIQDAMEKFMEQILNNPSSASEWSGISKHLTSCTFSSAWKDAPNADCILTLHYDHPLDESCWKRQAQRVCEILELRQLNGRSKGVVLFARAEGSFTGEEGVEMEATIRDTVFLTQRNCQGVEEKINWSVSLDNQAVVSAMTYSVMYEKPETAFYHPNASAMLKALAWMLDRLTDIVQRHRATTGKTHAACSLLEMYCGCGAHTVALGRTGLLSKILAVELDPRLVLACERNVTLNRLESLVEVRRSDAGQWAKEESRRRRRKKGNGAENNGECRDAEEQIYDILLVDPPRQGLDERVCQMALQSDGSMHFMDFLYISCGHQALLRDLERLAPVYEVVHCAQMDLFPRTDSIETMVHLRRRK